MQALPPPCTPAVAAVLETAGRQAAAGDYRTAAEALRLAAASDGACVPLSLAAWSSRGWIGALDAASAGGTQESLTDVTRALEVLAGLGGPSSAAAYAAALLHAAAAAAQDERDEMTLWLDHARDLMRRPGPAGQTPPHWPLPFDLAEGELWLGVDDFELAELAFAKALALEDSPVAWFGMARARAGRGDTEGACQAYRRVNRPGVTAPELAAASARALERCQV